MTDTNGKDVKRETWPNDDALEDALDNEFGKDHPLTRYACSRLILLKSQAATITELEARVVKLMQKVVDVCDCDEGVNDKPFYPEPCGTCADERAALKAKL